MSQKYEMDRMGFEPTTFAGFLLTQCECVIQTKLDDRSNKITMLGVFLSLDFFKIISSSCKSDKIYNCKIWRKINLDYFLMPRFLFFSLRYGFLHFLHRVALMSFRALQLKQIFITKRAPCAIRFFSGSVIGIKISPQSLTINLIGFSHLSCKQYWNFCWSFCNWNICLVKH